MKQFDDQYVSGWYDASDPEILALINKARAKLNEQERRNRAVRERYSRMVDRCIDISDRH